MAILISCGSPYTHKEITPEARPDAYKYKLDNVFFTLVTSALAHSERGSSFVTEWSVKNRDNKKRKIRLSEQNHNSYLLYGFEAEKVPLYGTGIGTCEGQGPCLSYLNLLPQQTLTFVLKSPPRKLRGIAIDDDEPVKTNIRARFEIKEEGHYTYPVDIEFNNVMFQPKNRKPVFGKVPRAPDNKEAGATNNP